MIAASNNYNAAPDELKQLARWVCWKFETKPGDDKPSKLPCNAYSAKINAHDPALHMTFSTARDAAAVNAKLAGIGFVLTDADDLLGLDFDWCLDAETGEPLPWAKGLLERLAALTYCERSPSGQGVKFFARGKLPNGCPKRLAYLDGEPLPGKSHIEQYEDGRFFTVTGQQWGTVDRIGDVQEIIDELQKRCRKPETARRTASAAVITTSPVDRDRVIRRASAYLAKMPPSVSGSGGHDAAYAAAQAMVNGFALDAADAEQLLLAEFNPQCSPPWSDADLIRKVSEAIKSPGDKPRGWLLNAERPQCSRSDFGAYDVANVTHGQQTEATAERASESAVGLLEADPPSIVLDEGRTESAFSQRVHRTYGHKIRHVDEWNRFLVYNGLHWEVDQGAQLDAMIREQAARLFNEAAESSEELEPTDWRDLIRHAKAMNSARGVSATRALLPSEPGMSIAVNEMDRQPGLLNVQNGVIDLRTGELLPHDPSLLLTRLAPVEYDPQAQCPLWRKFIGEIFDDELVDHIQTVVGYVLTASVREQKLFTLWGNGANGKSTFVETVQSLLGAYATSAAPDLLLVKGDAHPTEIAALHGHRLVVCSETEEGRRLAEARVKLLTGGDVLSARRMREDYWNFPPVHKLFLLTNHKPELRGTDAGIRRRLHLIPFRVTFTAEQQDRSLGRKLKAELPGILNWATEGAIRWFRDGLGEPTAVREATDAYIADQDTVGQYIADNCIVANWAKVRANSLFDNYRNWCEGQGEQAWTLKRFGQSIAERGFAKRSSNGTWYDGLCIRENE